MSYSLRWLRSASHQCHACWWLCKCSYLPYISWLLLCLWCWLGWQISFLLPCILDDFHWLNTLVWRIIMIAQQEEAMLSWAKLWNQFKKFRSEIQRNRKTWLISSYISCVKASAVESRSITSIDTPDRFIRESAILSYESVDSQPIIIYRLLIKCRSSADRVSIRMSIEYRSRCRLRASIENFDRHSTTDAFSTYDPALIKTPRL